MGQKFPDLLQTGRFLQKTALILIRYFFDKRRYSTYCMG